MGCRPAQWRELLASVGLTTEDLDAPSGVIPLEKGLSLFEVAAAEAGNPALGIDFAKSFSVGGTGPLGLALVNARTVRDALRTLSRFVPLIATVQMFRYEQVGDAGSLVWRYPDGLASPATQFATFGVAVTMLRIAGALPRDWKPVAVEFACPPPSSATAHRAFFGPGLVFDPSLPLYRLAVQAELLDNPMPEANPRLFELMTQLAEIEQRVRGTYASELESEVRAAVPALLPKGHATPAGIAAALGTTQAELKARLKVLDLDVRSLVEDVRRETARAYLQETELSVTDISFALGYSEISVFTRACTKWFGRSPREMRATPGAGQVVR